VDVRVISATNRNLKEMVALGKFREDLYYRLAVVPLELPPLRHRRNDIILLAGHFLAKEAEKQGRKPPELSGETTDRLLQYRWPGNVRQLQNALQFAVIKCRGGTVIGPEHLPPEILETGIRPAAENGGGPGNMPGRPGRKLILNAPAVTLALKKSGGNKAKAARILGVGRATLYNFIENHQDVLRP
jgi:DNA-binding NtrC family response regulator